MDIHSLLLRIRKDYLFAPRHEEYRRLLKVARQQGYKAMSLQDIHSRRGEQELPRVLALRHDVDNNNPKGLRLFFDLEQEFGVSATYYFRLKTLTMTEIITDILEHGSEIGYHFEEPAGLAKRYRITSRRELETEENRTLIDELMARNIQGVNARLGTPVRSLCSHGDFYNRRIGVQNHAFLSDAVRRRFNILFEANDPSFLGLFDEYFSDVTIEPYLWREDRSPVEAMLNGVPKLCVLTHPRQWHPAPILNTVENVRRLFQELYYRMLYYRTARAVT